MVVYQGRTLGKALIDEGLIPANARLLDLVIPADGAVVLRLELFVSYDDLAKLIRAMQTIVAKE
jgi:hypothetical protein